jgi:RNA polymerase primary sigma factor
MKPSLLDALTKREKQVIALRFGSQGIGRGRPKTLEEVGRRLALTRERIRQIQNIALNKVRGEMERQGIKLEEKNVRPIFIQPSE